MMGDVFSVARKRAHPRVTVDAFCTELVGDRPRHAIAVDLSSEGLRIQRPVGGRRPQSVPIELEIPGIDEVIWALGEVRYDEVWRVPPNAAGRPSGLLRTTGLHLAQAAQRHRRILREFVYDTYYERFAPIDETCLMRASCYRRG